MIRRLFQHLRSFLHNPVRYLMVTRRIRRIDRLWQTIHERTRNAKRAFGVRPGLRWENYDTQMAQIREMERGDLSLPGLAT